MKKTGYDVILCIKERNSCHSVGHYHEDTCKNQQPTMRFYY